MQDEEIEHFSDFSNRTYSDTRCPTMIRMWRRFTARARMAVFYAQEESQNEDSGYVKTEHLLLGLIRESNNVAHQVLTHLGVPIDRIRAEILAMPDKQEPVSAEAISLTPRVKRVIDLSYEEARSLNNQHIGTEHLLLGLILEGNGVAGRVLAKLGADIERAREYVRDLQQSQLADPSQQIEPRPDLPDSRTR